jgi:hypothetical protein
MKFGMWLPVAPLITVLVPVGSANAQDALVLSKLTEWNDSAPAPADQTIKVDVRKTVEELYGKTVICLGSKIVVSKVEPATADRYATNGRIAGDLRNAWFVTAQLPKCDTAPVRFMVLQRADASLKTIRVNRGTSYAWESLIADTFPRALIGAHIALSQKGLNCGSEEKAILGILRISSEEPDLAPVQFGVRYKGRWTEIWPLELCNHTIEVTVAFTADGEGGAYSRIVSDKTRILP